MWSGQYCSVLWIELGATVEASWSYVTEPMSWKSKGNLVVEHDIEEGAVHLQPIVRIAVVFNEAQFPELIHEETDARARGADHLREHFLTHLCHDRFWLAFFAKMGHKQQHACEPLLTGIKELIHQVFLGANVAKPGDGRERVRRKRARHEEFGSWRFC